jgi:hypothetical protein
MPGVNYIAQSAKIQKSCNPPIVASYPPASFMRGGGSCPPHSCQVGPVAGFKELLSYEIAGIGASAALFAAAEIRPAVFVREIRIKNIEERTGWQVLANPEVPVWFNIKEEIACKTAPIKPLVPELLFSSPNKEICFYERR